jgi:hypothetical protein
LKASAGSVDCAYRGADGDEPASEKLEPD